MFNKGAVLAKLRAFLDENEPRLAYWLYRLWEGQQNAVTYKELREAVLRGGVTATQLQAWQIEYAEFINKRLTPKWTKAFETASPSLPQIYALDYTAKRGAELVTNLVEEQRTAVQNLINQAVVTGIPPDTLAKTIRPVIGLTIPQTLANWRYYDNMVRAQIDNGVKPPVAETRAREAAAKYAARQHRYRAETIARTELAKAYNQAAQDSVTEARKNGLIGNTVKVWLTADDERVCPECGASDGETVGERETFRRTGVSLPPAHPNCRCAVAYEEATENSGLTNPANGSIIDTMDRTITPDERFAWLTSASEAEKIKFLGGKTKAALFDAGLLDRADWFKPLKDINLGGVILPDRATLTHSILGEYSQPSKAFPNGNIRGGAHTAAGLAEMKRRGISAVFVREASNGVRFYNVPRHSTPFKRFGGKHTVFPADWTEQDIFAAGILAANRGNIVPYAPWATEAVFKGINVRYIPPTGNGAGSIFPSFEQ